MRSRLIAPFHLPKRAHGSFKHRARDGKGEKLPSGWIRMLQIVTQTAVFIARI
jgi:hypothetical protein